MTIVQGNTARVGVQPRALVVEDEPEIRDLIVLHLRRDGFFVEPVNTAEGAMRKISEGKYDLLALDWMLPGMSGPDLARALRRGEESKDVPILMITARTDATDIVAGLEAGADDYLTKPFDSSVLLARARALLRRQRRQHQNQSESSRELQLGDVHLNLDTYDVTCRGVPLSLTPSEFKLLVTLAQNKGRVLTRDALIQAVQGDGVSVVGRTIDTHVFGLRKKLGESGDVIETIRGVGYRVNPQLGS